MVHALLHTNAMQQQQLGGGGSHRPALRNDEPQLGTHIHAHARKHPPSRTAATMTTSAPNPSYVGTINPAAKKPAWNGNKFTVATARRFSLLCLYVHVRVCVSKHVCVCMSERVCLRKLSRQKSNIRTTNPLSTSRSEAKAGWSKVFFRACKSADQRPSAGAMSRVGHV